MRSVVLAGLLASIAGVGHAQQAPQASTWQPAIEQHFARTLKDPYSAVKRQSSAPWREAFKRINGGQPTWAVCYVVNAKNAYGAYTGERYYLFLLSDAGALVDVRPSADGNYAFEAEFAEKHCAGKFTLPR